MTATTVAALRELAQEKEQEVTRLKGKVRLLQEEMKVMVCKNKVLEAAALQWQESISSPVVGLSTSSTRSRNEVFMNSRK